MPWNVLALLDNRFVQIRRSSLGDPPSDIFLGHIAIPKRLTIPMHLRRGVPRRGRRRSSCQPLAWTCTSPLGYEFLFEFLVGYVCRLCVRKV